MLSPTGRQSGRTAGKEIVAGQRRQQRRGVNQKRVLPSRGGRPALSPERR